MLSAAVANLIDLDALRAELQQDANPVTVFKAALRAGSDTLAARFHNNAPVEDVVSGRAMLVDTLLREAWQHLLPDSSDNLALVAVGGYGRGELHPASDVDLMILAGDQLADTEAIEQFLAFLWDIGIEVGHSVRTIDDCVTQARADITVITNLIEARHLCGSIRLFDAMRKAIATDKLWSSPEFFEGKLEEQHRRHRKYNDTAYNLEPNFKEGPGGLRDIQMVGWVAKRHFGATTLQDLISHGFLTRDECASLFEGQNFLWRIRYALHLLVGRREDRLLFDHQPTLARDFGYKDAPDNLAVEQFMQAYYRTVIELERLNEMLLQLFQEAILLADKPAEVHEISRRFRSVNGYIDVTHQRVFEHYPFALLEIFLELQQHPELKGVRAETIRLIRANRYRINDGFRANICAKSLFMEIIRQPAGVSHELRRMNRYGILAAYLPVFAKIVGRMQYDLFHAYTVDEHTLFVVRNLRRISIPDHAHELPVCSAVFYDLPKPELLYIAGLFHDIAKGRGGDHSELGSHDALAFAQDHGLSEYDAQLIAWLVRNHLLMSGVAQGKDISDPDVMHDFATQVGDQTHLNYLYLLTVADIRGTNPSLWNSWKNSLLLELYETASRILSLGLETPVDQADLIETIQSSARRLLADQNLDPAAIDALWARLPGEYFRRHQPGEIAWHTPALLATDAASLPLVLIRSESGRGSTEIFLFTEDCDNLFARNTATLDKQGLSIMDARILTTPGGQALSSYLVLDRDGESVTQADAQARIATAMRDSMRATPALEMPPARRVPRTYRHFPVQTRINVGPSSRGDQTVLEITTTDVPGLLARIAHALAVCKVRVHNAKVRTTGSRAEDVFFITDRKDQPISDDNKIAQLKTQVLKTLADTPATG